MSWPEDESGNPGCPFPVCNGYGVPTGETERFGDELTIWFRCHRCAAQFYAVKAAP